MTLRAIACHNTSPEALCSWPDNNRQVPRFLGPFAPAPPVPGRPEPAMLAVRPLENGRCFFLPTKNASEMIHHHTVLLYGNCTDINIHIYIYSIFIFTICTICTSAYIYIYTYTYVISQRMESFFTDLDFPQKRGISILNNSNRHRYRNFPHIDSLFGNPSCEGCFIGYDST